MRRTTTLATVACLAGLTLGAGSTAPAMAAATCDGRAATIVVTSSADQPFTATVTGTPGDDVIVGSDDDDTIDGGGGNDVICGLDGADTLVGGDGDDRLFGGADDEYEADEGYYGDLLVPGAGDDHVDLGTGAEDIWFWESDLQVDQVSYADSPVGVRVDLTAGTAIGHGTDTIVVGGASGRPVGVIGSAHDDTLLGTVGRDVVDAGGGDDTVVTGEGADVVLPDSPGRTTSGWRYDDDRPAGPGSQPGDDTVTTGGGSDGVYVQHGADVVRGGADVDRLTSYSPEPGTRLIGGEGKDRLWGHEGATLLGGSGNDQLDAELTTSAPATWDGGAGRDALRITVPRGRELDTLRIDVPRRRVTADGDRVAAIASVERVDAAGRIDRATFVGGPASEQFYASARGTTARGGAGADRLHGTRRADLLDGGPGRDVLRASGGRDRCLRGERLSGCEVRR